MKFIGISIHAFMNTTKIKIGLYNNIDHLTLKPNVKSIFVNVSQYTDTEAMYKMFTLVSVLVNNPNISTFDTRFDANRTKPRTCMNLEYVLYSIGSNELYITLYTRILNAIMTLVPSCNTCDKIARANYKYFKKWANHDYTRVYTLQLYCSAIRTAMCQRMDMF